MSRYFLHYQKHIQVCSRARRWTSNPGLDLQTPKGKVGRSNRPWDTIYSLVSTPTETLKNPDQNVLAGFFYGWLFSWPFGQCFRAGWRDILSGPVSVSCRSASDTRLQAKELLGVEFIEGCMLRRTRGFPACRIKIPPGACVVGCLGFTTLCPQASVNSLTPTARSRSDRRCARSGNLFEPFISPP